jgi:hypothetical protein
MYEILNIRCMKKFKPTENHDILSFKNSSVVNYMDIMINATAKAGYDWIS